MTLTPLPSGTALNGADQTNPDRPLHDVAHRLQGVIRALAEFGKAEEQQFLVIGTHLSDFLGRSRAVSRQSDEAIEALVRHEGEETLAALRTLLDSFEAHIEGVISEAVQHDGSLQRVLTHLHRIDEPLHYLTKVVKALLALSFSTRVESSRGQAGQVLQTLANDLKELGGKIDSKTEAVRERLVAMTELVLTAQQKTRKLQGDSLQQVRSTLHQCRLLLEILGARREQSLADANLLKDYSRDVTTAISEVVAAIQFHDITRQQVEHVRQALGDVCDDLTARLNGREGQVALVDICRVQAAQLRHTRGELVSAVARIIKNLQDIARAVDHLSRQTRSVSASAEDAGRTFFDDVEPVIAVITTILNGSTADNREAIAAVDAVLKALDELSRLLEEIEMIGTEMKLISLNAGITAAHSMERGAGLGVIAASIQTLSGEVLNRTREFSVVYREMDLLARALKDEAQSGTTTSDEAEVYALNDRAGALTGRLHAMNQGLVTLLRDMDCKASVLSRDIADAADGISIHIDAGQLVETLLGELQEIIELFQQSHSVQAGTDDLQRLARRYTMQSERKVHHEISQFLPGESAAVGLNANRNALDLTGLGENIELF